MSKCPTCGLSLSGKSHLYGCPDEIAYVQLNDDLFAVSLKDLVEVEVKAYNVLSTGELRKDSIRITEWVESNGQLITRQGDSQMDFEPLDSNNDPGLPASFMESDGYSPNDDTDFEEGPDFEDGPSFN